MSYVIRAPGTVHAATLRRSDPPGRDFFGTAYGQSGDRFDGFQLGTGSVIFDDTLLLIEPEAAAVYEAANRPAEPTAAPTPGQPSTTSPGGSQPVPGAAKTTGPAGKPRSFHATAEVPAATAKMRLVQIADEIVTLLNGDPNAVVRVVVEISAEFPDGAKDTVMRAVSENARSLGLKRTDWE